MRLLAWGARGVGGVLFTTLTTLTVADYSRGRVSNVSGKAPGDGGRVKMGAVIGGDSETTIADGDDFASFGLRTCVIGDGSVTASK